MCIIAVCKQRKLTEDELKNCFEHNNDGAGIAWCQDGENYYIKGLMTLDIVKYFYETINVFPHVVHFRNATSGGVSEELTHPFIVSAKSPLPLDWHGKEPLFFHNGVLSSWESDLFNFYIKKNKRIPDGSWSDSRFIAILVHYLGPNVLNFLKRGGKYALLNKNKITIYGNFIENNGVYFSNETYKQKSIIFYRKGGVNYGWWHEDEPGYAGYWGGGQNKMATPKKNSTGNNGKTDKPTLLNNTEK